MRKLLLTAFAVIMATVAALAAGPHLRLVPGDSVDFGDFNFLEPQHGSIRVTNDGDSTLLLLRTYTDCGCTVASIPKTPIEPGDTAEIRVSYDGRRMAPGRVLKIIRLRSNATNPVVNIFLKGSAKK